MLVSIITPTTKDRSQFLERVKALVAYQDYPYIEHLIDDGNGNVGQKRNRLCAQAKGEIIVHFDDDDIYASDWVSRCVQELQDKPCTGLRQCYFHDVVNDIGYLYSYPEIGMLYMPEAALAYRKSHWEKHRHSEVKTGECVNLYKGAKPHNYLDGFVATIHGGNTSSKVNGSFWRRVDIAVVKRLYI